MLCSLDFAVCGLIDVFDTNFSSANFQRSKNANLHRLMTLRARYETDQLV